MNGKLRLEQDLRVQKESQIRRLQDENNILRGQTQGGGIGNHYHADAKAMESKTRLVVERDRTIQTLQMELTLAKHRLDDADKKTPVAIATPPQRTNAAVDEQNRILVTEKSRLQRDYDKEVAKRKRYTDERVELRNKNLVLKSACDGNIIKMYDVMVNMMQKGREMCAKLRQQEEDIETLSCINAQMKDTCDLVLKDQKLRVVEFGSADEPALEQLGGNIAQSAENAGVVGREHSANARDRRIHRVVRTLRGHPPVQRVDERLQQGQPREESSC